MFTMYLTMDNVDNFTEETIHGNVDNVTDETIHDNEGIIPRPTYPRIDTH